MGIDSVKVTRKNTSDFADTDSIGRFTFPTVGNLASGRSNPELIWLSASRTLAWSGVTSPVSIIIAMPPAKP